MIVAIFIDCEYFPHNFPKLRETLGRLSDQFIEQDFYIFGILLFSLVVGEEYLGVSDDVERSVLRFVLYRYGIPYLLTDVRLLLLRILDHHEFKSVRRLDLEVSDKRLTLYHPQIPVVLPEVLDHVLEVESQIVSEEDFSVGLGKVT